jgi:hypothetical protein
VIAVCAGERTLGFAATYGRVRGAMRFTRDGGAMYVRTRGENTYDAEQNTYEAGGAKPRRYAQPRRQYQEGGIGAQPT